MSAALGVQERLSRINFRWHSGAKLSDGEVGELLGIAYTLLRAVPTVPISEDVRTQLAERIQLARTARHDWIAWPLSEAEAILALFQALRTEEEKAEIRAATDPAQAAARSAEAPDGEAAEPSDYTALLDFACAVSDAVWGGELAWDQVDGLRRLAQVVRRWAKERAALRAEAAGEGAAIPLICAGCRRTALIRAGDKSLSLAPIRGWTFRADRGWACPQCGALQPSPAAGEGVREHVREALQAAGHDVLWAAQRLPVTRSTAAPEEYEDEPSQMGVRLRRALRSLEHAAKVLTEDADRQGEGGGA